jgi:hypothetical protein
MHGVREFGHALLRELGAPKSQTIEAFAEVRFKDPAGKSVIPDGGQPTSRCDRQPITAKGTVSVVLW